ncbi:transposable element Tcb1 transposase [Trichonephila clavipes]|nr:transposable element Tcb1 transposase [Trichonephila clavipes]
MGDRSATSKYYIRREHIGDLKEVGQLVGRNQTTVMQICYCWRQKETMDRRGQSHPPCCTIARDYRWIVHMAVVDRAATSRTIAQQIQSVTHHSVPARNTVCCRVECSQGVHCFVYP